MAPWLKTLDHLLRLVSRPLDSGTIWSRATTVFVASRDGGWPSVAGGSKTRYQPALQTIQQVIEEF